MHICFATIDSHTAGGGGGIASYVTTLGGELVRRGHKVTVLSRGPQHEAVDAQGLRMVSLPLGNLHWYIHKLPVGSKLAMPIRELEWSWSLRRLFQRVQARDRIDLVEGTENGCLFLSGQRTPPVVLRLHGDQFTFLKHSGSRPDYGMRLNRRLTLRTLERAQAVTAPSKFAGLESSRQLSWPAERVNVIANPISCQFLNQIAKSRPFESVRNPNTVLYTGRIEQRKGTLTLLRSIPSVTRKLPQMHFQLVGGRHVSISDDLLNGTLDETGARPYCELLGHVPWGELIELYMRASIFVMPSLYESFGISIIEAMACGLPVVATTAGGIPEVVDDGITGLLVPPDDPLALAEAIVRLARDPQLRERLGRAGQEKVARVYTPQHIADQTLAVYERCLLRARTP